MGYSQETLKIRKTQKTICACGCGEVIPAYTPSGGNKVRFKIWHQGREKTPARMAHIKKLARQSNLPAWNKGRTYTFSNKFIYRFKTGWSNALKKCFKDQCMICGWSEVPCDCHHIIPRSKGGKNSLENGVILCPNHHRLVHHKKITPEQLAEARAKQVSNVSINQDHKGVRHYHRPIFIIL